MREYALNMQKDLQKDFMGVPLNRILEKFDSHMTVHDYAEAERHLLYWASEADTLGDALGKLALLNEQVGFYRRTQCEEKGMTAIADALKLAEALDIEGSAGLATTYVNCATGFCAFGKAEMAIPLYQKAKQIYSQVLDADDSRMASLCNNMALAYIGLGEYDKAESLFKKAIDIMSHIENGEMEMAVSYCNMADMLEAEFGSEQAEKQIAQHLMTAKELLDLEKLPRNGHYAFVCEKCADAFGHFGYFVIEEDLKQRAADIIAAIDGN